MSSDLTVIPPGPVSDRTRVELRLALANPDAEPASRHVQLRLGSVVLAERDLTVAPRSSDVWSWWWDTRGSAGRVELVAEADGDGHLEHRWPLTVVPSDTVGLPLLQGAWIEPLAVKMLGVSSAVECRRRMRRDLEAMQALGVELIIVAYVEFAGTWYYPSDLAFHDADLGRESRGADCPFDLVGILLSEADRLGQHVVLGLGRGGDTPLLAEFDRADWPQRLAGALDLGRRVADELWRRYGHHPSFYGWYLTHELNDLARAAAYYDPMAEYCHGLAPGKPVLVAPDGTPRITPELLAHSQVDVFVYQDAVGAGYVPYRYTYDPAQRLAMLDEAFAGYAELHQGTGKHLWGDLEVWQMDGRQGYGNPFPAAWERVQRQLEIERRHVPVLTAYAWHGFLEPPGDQGGASDERARRLFDDYAAHVAQVRQHEASGPGR